MKGFATLTATEAPAVGMPSVDERSWLRWGAVAFVAVETVHVLGGLVINEWEGWSTFFSGLSFIVVSGLVIVALVYGLLVRWGLKPSPGNRPAYAALAAALLSVAGYVVLFTWAHLLIAPAAVLLGRAGLARTQEGRGGRAYALTGVAIGVASFTVGVVLLVYALIDGDYPIDFLG